MRKRASTGWRSAYGTTSPIQAIDSGMIAAAVAPDSTRVSRSARKSGASALASDARAQAAAAQATTRYLPKRSPSGPKSSCDTP